MARKHDNRWYVAGVSAEDKPVTVTIDPALFLGAGGKADGTLLSDRVPKKVTTASTKAALPAGTDYELTETPVRLTAGTPLKLTLHPQGGFVLVF